MDKIEAINSKYDSLIISYLTNSISEDDKKVLIKWIESDKLNESYFNKLYESWIIAGSDKDMCAIATQPSWDKLNQRLTGKSRYRIWSENRSFSTRYLRLAASWLAFFMLGLSAMYLIKSKPATMSSKPVIISVPLGARSHIVLPDGTKIWLNAGTRITYNQDYGIKTRTLDLTGEAYFDVAKDKEHPFVVNTSGLRIRAMGTKFNVKAYPEEAAVLATLEEGKIDVQIVKSGGKTKSVVLLPNENVVFQKSLQAIAKSDAKERIKADDENTPESLTGSIATAEIKVMKNINTELFTSWKEEQWIIEGEPLGTLAPMLERRFNVKIQFKDELLKKYNFTGTIQNETIEQIMNALELTAPVNYSIKKDVIILTPDPAKQDQFKQIMKSSEK